MPSCEATTVRKPSHRCAWAISPGASVKSPLTRAIWIAATVRPGMARNHAGAIAGCDSSVGALAPRSALAGNGCTMK